MAFIQTFISNPAQIRQNQKLAELISNLPDRSYGQNYQHLNYHDWSNIFLFFRACAGAANAITDSVKNLPWWIQQTSDQLSPGEIKWRKLQLAEAILSH